eukprot:Sdes_comp24219_c0_seq1m22225
MLLYEDKALESSESNSKQENVLKSTPADETPDLSVDEEMCSICMEPFTTSGRHRIVSLKCGHIFGKVCIKKWLDPSQTKSIKNKVHKCPHCNMKATLKDLRPVFLPKRAQLIDNTEKEQTLK